MMRRLPLILTLLLLLASCGKRGPLIAPEGLRPGVVKETRVEQQGDTFLIFWNAPSRNAANKKPAAEVASYRIYRREVLPAGQDCEECAAAYQLVRTVEPDYLRGALHVGNTFMIADAEPATDRTWQYRITAVDAHGGESPLSPPVKRKKVTPPGVPNVTANPVPAAILLNWQPVAGEGVAGYNVYRRGPEDPAWKRLTAVPLAETTFEDVTLAPNVPYRYIVRTVAKRDGDAVESAPSPEVTATLTLP